MFKFRLTSRLRLLALSFGTVVNAHRRVAPCGSLASGDTAPQAGRQRRHGTSLLEIAVCVVIVGIGIVALMQSMASGTRANASAMDMTVGLNLARAGREWAATQDYAELQALCTTTKVCSPVIGGQGDAMPGYTEWSQEISARQVSATSLSDDTTAKTDTLRVTVTAKHKGSVISRVKWLVTNQAAATQPASIP